MHLAHRNDLDSLRRHRLSSGITPAQFEMDALRFDEMHLRAEARAELRPADKSGAGNRPAVVLTNLRVAIMRLFQSVTARAPG